MLLRNQRSNSLDIIRFVSCILRKVKNFDDNLEKLMILEIILQEVKDLLEEI